MKMKYYFYLDHLIYRIKLPSSVQNTVFLPTRTSIVRSVVSLEKKSDYCYVMIVIKDIIWIV